jgi:hypothetical protein
MRVAKEYGKRLESVHLPVDNINQYNQKKINKIQQKDFDTKDWKQYPASSYDLMKPLVLAWETQARF